MKLMPITFSIQNVQNSKTKSNLINKISHNSTESDFQKNNFGLYSPNIKLISFNGILDILSTSKKSNERRESRESREKQKVKELLNAQTDKVTGASRFTQDEIEKILNSINMYNGSLVGALINAKEDWSARFNGEEIKDILAQIDENNSICEIDLLDLLEARDENRNYRFNASSIANILSHINQQNYAGLSKIVQAENKNGEKMFSAEDICGILPHLTEKNSPYIYVICDLLKITNAENPCKKANNALDNINKDDFSDLKKLSKLARLIKE